MSAAALRRPRLSRWVTAALMAVAMGGGFYTGNRLAGERRRILDQAAHALQSSAAQHGHLSAEEARRQTALLRAIQHGDEASARLLRSADAEAQMPVAGGKSAVRDARDKRSEQIAPTIHGAGAKQPGRTSHSGN